MSKRPKEPDTPGTVRQALIMRTRILESASGYVSTTRISALGRAGMRYLIERDAARIDETPGGLRIYVLTEKGRSDEMALELEGGGEIHRDHHGHVVRASSRFVKRD